MSIPSFARGEQQLLEHGVCVVPAVLDGQETHAVREALLGAAVRYQQSGASTFMPELDPNDRNVRVFNLLELHGIFRELIMHPVALRFVEALLGEHYMVSNFTANIARPGSRSMVLHSDQALLAPQPWLSPWSINVIWCLDDVYEENGATRYLPGSQRCQRREDLPQDPLSHTRAFEAPAGSLLVMDGRVWHTSGANVTADAERALLFGYYSVDFLRPQVNWNAVLSLETQGALEPMLHERLGLGPRGNVRQAGTILGGGPTRRA